MMSAICEAWGIMRNLGMGYEEIGDVFAKWNKSGELVSSARIFPSMAADIDTDEHLSHLHRCRPLSQTRE